MCLYNKEETKNVRRKIQYNRRRQRKGNKLEVAEEASN